MDQRVEKRQGDVCIYKIIVLYRKKLRHHVIPDVHLPDEDGFTPLIPLRLIFNFKIKLAIKMRTKVSDIMF